MASKVEIANLALMALGANPISSFNEDSKESILINNIWAITRRSLLRQNIWNFAVRRASLPRISAPPHHQYSYAFQLPNDFIRFAQAHTNFNYRIENDKLLCNEESINVSYVADIQDTTFWSPDFTELFASKLAAELAYPITRDKDVMRLQHSLFKDKLMFSIFNDTIEDGQDQIPSEALMERR